MNSIHRPSEFHPRCETELGFAKLACSERNRAETRDHTPHGCTLRSWPASLATLLPTKLHPGRGCDESGCRRRRGRLLTTAGSVQSSDACSDANHRRLHRAASCCRTPGALSTCLQVRASLIPAGCLFASACRSTGIQTLACTEKYGISDSSK